jgi:hypothetical protein
VRRGCSRNGERRLGSDPDPYARCVRPDEDPSRLLFCQYCDEEFAGRAQEVVGLHLYAWLPRLAIEASRFHIPMNVPVAHACCSLHVRLTQSCKHCVRKSTSIHRTAPPWGERTLGPQPYSSSIATNGIGSHATAASHVTGPSSHGFPHQSPGPLGHI